MATGGGLGEIDEFFWGDLLIYIEERRVIPIIDVGSLRVRDGNEQLPLETLLARKLAERLRFDTKTQTAFVRLDDVVRHQRALSGRKDNLFLRLQQLLKDLAIEPPQALLDLASIDAFDLIVSVSCDDLLTRALDRVRHGGAAQTEVIAFAPNRSADLAHPRGARQRSTVFHLLGRLSSSPDSVMSDDDRLEFLHALQDDARRPKLLFDELRENHLLLLGCRIPDWAARFFLRTARSERLSLQEGDKAEFLVGMASAQDKELGAFLAAFRPSARIVPMDTEEFIAELRTRWHQAHPAGLAAVQIASPVESRGPADGAVFISYSRQDAIAAERLANALQVAGVDVWFDRRELKPGDLWESAILSGIKNCSLFIPIVSELTQAEDRRRAYFWREWNKADDMAEGMNPTEPFIVPVVIDGLDFYSASVPTRFRKANSTHLPDGEPTDSFVENIKELYLAYRRRHCHG